MGSVLSIIIDVMCCRYDVEWMETWDVESINWDEIEGGRETPIKNLSTTSFDWLTHNESVEIIPEDGGYSYLDDENEPGDVDIDGITGVDQDEARESELEKCKYENEATDWDRDESGNQEDENHCDKDENEASDEDDRHDYDDELKTSRN